MISVDTNIILRWLLDDIPQQTRKVEALFTELGSQQVNVADVVVAECVWVMESFYKLTRKEVCIMLDVLIEFNQISMNRKLFKVVLQMYSEKNSVSFIDCMLVAYSTLHNATPLYSFDVDMIKKFPEHVKTL